MLVPIGSWWLVLQVETISRRIRQHCPFTSATAQQDAQAPPVKKMKQ